MLKVLQTGTYSSWNKGDAAMQLSLRQLVLSRWPDSSVTVSAPFPDHDASLYGADALVASGRRSPGRILAQVGRVVAWRLMRHSRPRAAAAILAADEELNAMIDADVVVDLSGDMLTDDYGPHVALSHYHPLLLSHALGRPVFVCAQSVGPFRQTGRLARWLLERCAAITVRDALSLDNLDEIGLQGPQSTRRRLVTTEGMSTPDTFQVIVSPRPTRRLSATSTSSDRPGKDPGSTSLPSSSPGVPSHHLPDTSCSARPISAR